MYTQAVYVLRAFLFAMRIHRFGCRLILLGCLIYFALWVYLNFAQR